MEGGRSRNKSKVSLSEGEKWVIYLCKISRLTFTISDIDPGVEGTKVEKYGEMKQKFNSYSKVT